MMDQMLANFFGTGGTENQPSAEDAEKVAQAEFFAKTAAAQGINLEEYSPAQIDWLWQKTFGTTKVAEFPPAKEGKPEGDGDGDEKKEREEKARKEHEEKKASQERFEQATVFGKTAAHSYVAEMKHILEAGGLDFMKEAGLADKAKGVGKSFVKGLKGEGIKDSYKAMKRDAGASVHGELAARGDLKKAVGRTAASYGAAGAAAGAAGAAAHHASKSKEGSAGPSAFEMEAAELALAKVAEAEFDQDQAITRLNAVLTLGLNDSEKVASLATYEEALERRALEYAAAAGYPVEWSQ